MSRVVESTAKERTFSYAGTRYAQIYCLIEVGYLVVKSTVDRSRVRHPRRRHFRSAQLSLDFIHLLCIRHARHTGCDYGIIPVSLEVCVVDHRLDINRLFYALERH